MTLFDDTDIKDPKTGQVYTRVKDPALCLGCCFMVAGRCKAFRKKYSYHCFGRGGKL